jgi:hypothetical protein
MADWLYRTQDGINLQYNPCFAKMPWPKMKEIVDKVIASGCVWDHTGVVQAEVGCWEGITYLAFFICHPQVKDARVIVLESIQRFERGIGVPFKQLLDGVAKDGQHRHGK